MKSSNLPLKILNLLRRHIILDQFDIQVFEIIEFIKQGIKPGIWNFSNRTHLQWMIIPTLKCDTAAIAPAVNLVKSQNRWNRKKQC